MYDAALKTSKPRSPVHYAHCLSCHLLVNSTHGIRFFLASIFKWLTPLSKYIIAIIIIQHDFWDWSTGIFAFIPCLWYLRNCNNQYSTIDGLEMENCLWTPYKIWIEMTFSSIYGSCASTFFHQWNKYCCSYDISL